MKLYAYYFDGEKLLNEDVEVEEKSKTYVRTSNKNFPFTYRRVIYKKEIGKIVDDYNPTLYFTEPSIEIAREKFLKIKEEKLKCARATYDRALKQVKILRNMEV